MSRQNILFRWSKYVGCLFEYFNDITIPSLFYHHQFIMYYHNGTSKYFFRWSKYIGCLFEYFNDITIPLLF